MARAHPRGRVVFAGGAGNPSAGRGGVGRFPVVLVARGAVRSTGEGSCRGGGPHSRGALGGSRLVSTAGGQRSGPLDRSRPRHRDWPGHGRQRVCAFGGGWNGETGGQVRVFGGHGRSLARPGSSREPQRRRRVGVWRFQHRAPRGGHQELEGKSHQRWLPTRRAPLSRSVVRRTLDRSWPLMRRTGAWSLYLVVVARAGIRQRCWLAHRLPGGDAGSGGSSTFSIGGAREELRRSVE